MPNDCVSYQSSGYFSKLVIDYLNQSEEIKTLYHRFPELEEFEAQMQEKGVFFTADKRATLVSALQRQYRSTDAGSLTKKNIDSLLDSQTFTVTTGHQLNLFTGPLYFLYKIISVINLTKSLKEKYPGQHFVPVFWMASEDHDFEEINFFRIHGKKIRWEKESKGPVGRLSTNGLDAVLDVFRQEIGSNHNAAILTKIFENAYLKHQNLAEATRYLANEFFGSFGLVVLDGDDVALKQSFIPYIKNELQHRQAHQEVSSTLAVMNAYDIQVNPREINLFYIEDNLRERIVFDGSNYQVNRTGLQFSPSEIMNLVEQSPEKFSPNVILRPLYQEVILPNLCYIGGGAEIAYWLELKSFFDSEKVPFPILLLRNSVLLASKKQASKADKLHLTWNDLFRKQSDLLNQKAKEISDFPIDLSIQKDHLKAQFHYLYMLANQTDPSFSGAVKAQEAKQIKGLENLENRLLKAQKRKHRDTLERITMLQNELFPNQGLQERQVNFSEYFVAYGHELIDTLIQELDPLATNFNIITL